MDCRHICSLPCPEMCRKFSGPKIRLGVKLSLFNPSPENIGKFPFIVRRIRFFCHHKMKIYHIMHIPQHQRSPLLNGFICVYCRYALAVNHLFNLFCRYLIFDFVAPDVSKPYIVQHMNPINNDH